MTHIDDLVERIRPMVAQVLPRTRSTIHLGRDDFLAAHGMDSLRLMMLISALQREFSILVLEDDLLDENFASIGALAAFVAAKGGA